MTDSRADIVPRTLVIPSGSGTDYTLHEPSFMDVADGEEMLERALGRPMPFTTWFDGKTISFRVLGTVIWLAARKHNRTEQQCIDKDWDLTLDDLMRAFKPTALSAAHISKIAELFTPAAGEAADPDETAPVPSSTESAAGEKS